LSHYDDLTENEKGYLTEHADEHGGSAKIKGTPLEDMVADHLPGGALSNYRWGSPSTPGAMSVQEVQKTVDRVLRGKLSGLDVQVMDRPPGTLSGSAQIMKGETRPDGTIVVYADAAESPLDVARTVFHELFHRGLKRFFGSNRQYIKQLLELSASNNAVRQEAEAWKLSEAGQKQRTIFELGGALIGDHKANYEALAVEEALAQLGERLQADGAMGSEQVRSTVRAIATFMSKLADLVGLHEVAQFIRRATYSDVEKFVVDTIANSPGAVTAGTTARLDGSKDATVFRDAAPRKTLGPVVEGIARKLGGPSAANVAADATSLAQRLVSAMRFLPNLVDSVKDKIPAV